jgi:hypothetical protein
LICGCAEETLTVPEGFIISTSGFNFNFGSQTGNADMTGFAGVLSSLVNDKAVSLSVSPALSLKTMYAYYSSPIDGSECFSQTASLSLSCDFRTVGNALASPPRAVISFGAGRFCDDTAANGSPGCSITVTIVLPFFVLDFCNNPQPSEEIVFSDLSSLEVFALARCGFVGPNASSTGDYTAQSGTVTITPVFANPLP